MNNYNIKCYHMYLWIIICVSTRNCTNIISVYIFMMACLLLSSITRELLYLQQGYALVIFVIHSCINVIIPSS